MPKIKYKVLQILFANMKFCKKCGDKHLPPTGRNCIRSLSPERQMSASPVSITSTKASSGAGDEQDMVTAKGAAHKQTHKISSLNKPIMSVSEL